jgi:O-succinylbenzoate synthase
MKIDQVTLFHIKLPYVTPFQTSRWIEIDRECVLVRVRAAGLTAWGECVAGQNVGYSYETTKTNWHILEDFIVPAVLAADLDDVEAYRAAVAHISGHNMAKAGMELALWDLFGKRTGTSLQQLIGGQGERVKVGVSVGIQASPEKLVEVVGGYLAQGYGRVKLKIKPGRDVGDTAAVRQAYPDLMLQVDGNSVYRLEDAAHLQALDEFDLLLIEQPLGQDDIIDHAKLQPRLKTALCLDESIHSMTHARWALELGACRIINIKPGRVGGFSQSRAIHDLCRQHGIPVWCGGMLESGVGRAYNVALASLPNFTLPGDLSPSARYWDRDIVTPEWTMSTDGMVTVPTGPGIGVTVDEDRVDNLAIRRETLGA